MTFHRIRTANGSSVNYDGTPEDLDARVSGYRAKGQLPIDVLEGEEELGDTWETTDTIEE